MQCNTLLWPLHENGINGGKWNPQYAAVLQTVVVHGDHRTVEAEIS